MIQPPLLAGGFVSAAEDCPATAWGWIRQLRYGDLALRGKGRSANKISIYQAAASVPRPSATL